jgi:transcriptional regulator with XRE-family HTH domain
MVVGAEIKNVDMENEQKNIYQEISTKLGVDPESIAKIESGELSLDDYANSYFSNYENNLKARIGKQIESEKTSEAFAKAYGKAEKTLSDLFGLDSNKYAEIDKSERFSTMVSDIKKMTDEQLKSFESADSQKLAQLTEQLNQANALLKQK